MFLEKLGGLGEIHRPLHDPDGQVNDIFLRGIEVVTVPVEHVNSGHDRRALVPIKERVVQHHRLKKRRDLLERVA